MSAWNRRGFLTAAAASLVSGQQRPRPNIIFVLLDDLGYGDFGCYGQKLIRTPNVDRAAAEGLRFTDCYAGAAVCAPSRAVLMSGLHGGHAPIRANAGTAPIEADDITVAELLRKAGYATGGFGKWGLGDARTTGTPTRHGFDEFFGYLHQVHAHTYYPDFLWDNERKFELPANRGGKQAEYSADFIAQRSFEFVRRNKNRPFFLYGCYTLPHSRFEIPDVEPYANEEWSHGEKTYAAMITRADGYIGTLLRILGELNLERDTVVFITSDNGAHRGKEKGFELFRSNGPLRGQKGEVYEGGIRVPMIVRWTGRVKAGGTSRYPWAFCDVLPTLLDLAGAPRVPGIDGLSVAPKFFGREGPTRDYLYWEHNVPDRQGGRLRLVAQAVRSGGWKAVWPKAEGPIELYDLVNDVGETKNLAASHPKLVEKMKRYRKEARTEPRPHDKGKMTWNT
jgi:arylsulfatase A-like enzyme